MIALAIHVLGLLKKIVYHAWTQIIEFFHPRLGNANVKLVSLIIILLLVKLVIIRVKNVQVVHPRLTV